MTFDAINISLCDILSHFVQSCVFRKKKAEEKAEEEEEVPQQSYANGFDRCSKTRHVGRRI